jgi:hypothetical protein
MKHIEDSLAVALAGQVAVGLTSGDRQAERAQGALVAIGLMLQNSSESPLVRETLQMAGRTRIESADGLSYRIVPLGEEEA